MSEDPVSLPNPQWLHWARDLQAIAQTGLAYCKDPFDFERYSEIRKIAAEMISGGTVNAKHVIELFSRDRGYATPKVDVRTAVFDKDRVLMVREREDNGWMFPGGWADVGNSPSVSALREVREESGYEAAITKLAAVFDRDVHGHPPIPFHSYKIFFIGTLQGGSAQSSNETNGVDFFGEDEIPQLQLSLGRVMPAQIKLMFDHYRNPQWPTAFD